MDLSAIWIAALALLGPSPIGDRAAPSLYANAPVAERSLGGAVAMATVSVRILARPARIGDRHGPPLPNMVPRAATIAAADGTQVPALIYDFE